MARTLALMLAAACAAAAGWAGEAQAGYTASVASQTLTLTGNSASDVLELRLSGTSATTLVVDVGDNGTADFSFDRTTFTDIVVNAAGGVDTVRIDEFNGLFDDESLFVDGGDGNDILLGGSGDDLFIGAAGEDFVDGNRGEDVAFLGSHDDTYHWDPGDANDTLEGQSGTDTLDFNGSNASENYDVLANGGRVLFLRDVATVAMDMDDMERLDVHALGGADTLDAADLTGTDFARVDADLAAFGGGGDAQLDVVNVDGSDAVDQVDLRPAPGGLLVRRSGLEVRVTDAEPTDDVNVRTFGNSDLITGVKGLAGPAAVDVDGGLGNDTVRFDGSAAGDDLQVGIVDPGEPAVSALGAATRIDLAAEDLVVRGLDGPDSITALGNLAVLTELLLDGGGGADTLLGGNGDDVLIGGSAADFVDGNQGLDLALLGSHADVFEWDPGDGSDTIEGQDGPDRLLFNGSNASENYDLLPNGGRVFLLRDVAAITTDMNDVERLDLNTLGGADTFDVGDLSGTDLTEAEVDLASVIGGTGGDAQIDSVNVAGTNIADSFQVRPAAAGLIVRRPNLDVRVRDAEPTDDVNVNTLDGNDTITGFKGLAGPAAVDVDGGAADDTVRFQGSTVGDTLQVATSDPGQAGVAEAGAATRIDAVSERLVVLGLDGPDHLSALGNLAPLTLLTLDGAGGPDTLLGGNGPDTLLGGPAGDFVDGNQGADFARLGTHPDTFQWDPGDGSDTIEGQDGPDLLRFNASNASENIVLSDVGGRIRLTRDVAAITADGVGIEQLELNVVGGSDTVTVNNMAGTHLTAVDVDLAGPGGGGDGQADDVVLNGTGNPDAVQVTAPGGEVRAAGLAATLDIQAAELANDQLFVNTLGGNDTVTVSALAQSLIDVVVDLGAGG